MALPTFLASAIASWADFYDAHRMLSVSVRYLHLAGLVVGGGTALATDRRVLRALRSDPPERSATVAALHASHRVVVPALALVVMTGVLMTASDTATFLASPLFWAKMGLVTLLLLNGVGLVAAERAVTRERAKGWSWLGVTSAASLVLWLVILFMGIWLTSAA
jgi:hypothetical protein